MLPRVAALIAIGLGVLEANPLAAAADRAARFCTSCDVACAPGHNQAVQLARRWEAVVEWRFDRDLSNWQIKNCQQALKIEVADDAAVGRSLFVHRDDKEIDTAFELTSPPIPVAEAALCRLTITAAHTLDLSMAQGHKESFQNQIRWLDGDGRELEATPFRFAAPSDAWYDVTVESRAPRGAAMAVVQIGFDSPNLFSSRQFRLRSVAWSAQPDRPPYAAEGEMISRPQRMTEPCEQGRVCWQADAPEGTNVGLQVRSAVDRDGGPCDWTPLAGPDGTPNSQFTSSGTRLPAIHAGHHWFQYRLTLGTNRAAVTPVVRQVRLGDEQRWIEDLAWPGAGNACEQLWWISVQPPPASGVTAMRDDGVILVDGQPLFPIGLYSVWKREHNGSDFNRCFTELREAGFNTIHTYHAQRDADLQEFYAAAERHGLRVIIAPRGGANSRDPQNAVRTVIEAT